jgi:2,4-dienoyl-CoA reductase-like NADH-dependent reductase (Old Yellow Enzyme family)
VKYGWPGGPSSGRAALQLRWSNGSLDQELCVGRFSRANHVTGLERGEFDWVAVGRALLQESQCAIKVKDQRFDQLCDYEATTLEIYY